jgi:hypothetical protein
MKNKAFLLALSLSTACTFTGVFVPDPIDPRLPMYTETGNDVAGAFVNKIVWKSIATSETGFISPGYDFGFPSIYFYDSGDRIKLKLTGKLSGVETDLIFDILTSNISSPEDFARLNDSKIILDGVNNKGYLRSSRYQLNASGGVGQIYFKKINVSGQRISIAGTFGFLVSDPIHGNLDVSYGRFDYGECEVY